MERQWLNLDQIKAEYASNDYNPELLLQHLLHHVESSPASVPEVTDGMAIAFHNALTDGAIGQAEVDEIKTGLRAALAAAPTPPVSEDRKDAERYRWLRKEWFREDEENSWFMQSESSFLESPDEFDAAIDAAIEGK